MTETEALKQRIEQLERRVGMLEAELVRMKPDDSLPPAKRDAQRVRLVDK